jgi:hypothetical protein
MSVNIKVSTVNISSNDSNAMSRTHLRASPLLLTSQNENNVIISQAFIVVQVMYV